MRHRYLFEEKRYTFGGSVEIERIRTGKPPERRKRRKRAKATPEQVAYQNMYNKRKNLRRLIKKNFGENDYWITLTYQRGHSMSMEDAVKDRGKFLRKLRAEYMKRGWGLKWIGRTERGKRGAVHHHLILSREDGADLVISKVWKSMADAGNAKLQFLYERGQFKELAAYITKPDDTNEEGIATSQSNYSRSRNLVIPVPKISRTTRKKIVDLPEPSPGYYIDMDSICQGVNPITGREYLHYIEIKIQKGGGG